LRAIFIFVFCVFFIDCVFAQSDSISFNIKEEVAFDGKRYRVHNSWLSFGAGPNYNTKWPKDEKNIGADFSFFIKQHYFRLGGFISGTDFTISNNYSIHLCYGLRKETNKYNLSAFVGPSSSYFRRQLSDSTTHNLRTVYNELGAHICLEAIYKIKYDIGLGGQIFCDYNRVQMIYGVRLIAYFSGAYRGIKYGRAPVKNK